MEDFGFLKIGNIREVKHFGYYSIDTYMCQVDIEWPNGELETVPYSANAVAEIQPGKWVYEQILAGNFSGEITEQEPPVLPAPEITDEELVQGL